MNKKSVTVESESFMEKLTKIVNQECEKGAYAETIIGTMRRIEMRLLMAAEKATATEKASQLNQEKKDKGIN